MRFSESRRQYTLGGLRRQDLAADPVEQFVQWQDQAIAAGLADPTACVLATLQPERTLRQRMVLMKGIDDRGLVFFTNYQSGKAVALGESDAASMLFPWNELDRQVSVTSASCANNISRLSIGWLCAEAQAPSWLSRGREAK